MTNYFCRLEMRHMFAHWSIKHNKDHLLTTTRRPREGERDRVRIYMELNSSLSKVDIYFLFFFTSLFLSLPPSFLSFFIIL
jgi:hypothetical protein